MTRMATRVLPQEEKDHNVTIDPNSVEQSQRSELNIEVNLNTYVQVHVVYFWNSHSTHFVPFLDIYIYRSTFDCY